jgi:hypothetical protein
VAGRLAEVVDPHDLGRAGHRELIRPDVEGVLVRSGQAAFADGAGDPVRQPLPQQRTVRRGQQRPESRGHQHLAGLGQHGDAGRQHRVSTVGPQRQAADPAVAVLGVEVGHQHRAVGGGQRVRLDEVVRPGRAPVLVGLVDGRRGAGQQQQRHPQPDADRGQHQPRDGLPAAAGHQPHAQPQVAGPAPDEAAPGVVAGQLLPREGGHDTSSASRVRPSRTTISRSE